MKCLADLAKLYIFLINLLATTAFGLISAGIVYFVLHSKRLVGFHIEPNLSPDNPSALHFSLALIVLTLTGFFCLFTFLGCCGVACHNRCMLGSFVLILSIFALITSVLIACLFTYHSSEVEWLSYEAKKTILYYDPVDETSIVRSAWDNVHQQLQCCGAHGIEDWAKSQGIKPGRKVPASCCRDHAISDCVFEPDHSNAYMQGCFDKFALDVRVAFWVVPIVIATSFLASLLVYSRLQKQNEHHDQLRAYTDGRKVYLNPAAYQSAQANMYEPNQFQYYRAVPPPYSSQRR